VYTADSGGYEIEYSTNTDGPFTSLGVTEDKTVDSMTVTDLSPETRYYFRVRTVTYPHSSNQNTVYSDYTSPLLPVTTSFPDYDEDGMPDEWEIEHGLNPENPDDAAWDLDEDGLNSLNEFNHETDPNDSDTDADCLTDGAEVAMGLRPHYDDSDEDGFSDGQEVGFGSNPIDIDSTPEICDGIDNDLDKSIDEDVCDERSDHKGREFILAFMPSFNWTDNPDDPQVSLIITSDLPSDVEVTVEYPVDTPTFKRTVFVNQKNSAEIIIDSASATGWLPCDGDSCIPANNAVRVSATDEISVVMLHDKPVVRDQALALPVDVLGSDYLIISKTPGVSQGSQFIVVAVEDNTTVSIYPIENKIFDVTLKRGQGILVESYFDLTGSRVAADHPVAVFNGNKCANVPTNDFYCEHLFEMAIPAVYWGSDYFARNLPRTDGGTRRTFYRMLASQDGTVISVNGSPVGGSYDVGEVMEISLEAAESPVHLSANKPIAVAQYMNGICNEFPEAESCIDKWDGVQIEEYGDASMTNLTAYDQYPVNYTFEVPGSNSWINVIASFDDVQCQRVLLDGLPLDPTDFSRFPAPNNDYAHASIPVELGLHTSRSAQGHALTAVYLGWHSAMTHPLGIRFPEFAAPPNPPTNLELSAGGTGSTKLTWDDVNDELGYRIFYGSSENNSNVLQVGSDVTSLKISGLLSGITYYFAVTAYNKYGESDWLISEEGYLVP
jgi:hypothetical protein